MTRTSRIIRLAELHYPDRCSDGQVAPVLKAQEMDSCVSSEVLKTPPTHQAHTQICSRGHDPITARSSEISGTSPSLGASILKP